MSQYSTPKSSPHKHPGAVRVTGVLTLAIGVATAGLITISSLNIQARASARTVTPTRYHVVEPRIDPIQPIAPAAQTASQTANAPPAPIASPKPELMTETPAQAINIVDRTPRKLSSEATPRTRTVWMEVTAYCACSKCCGEDAHGVTASGKTVRHNRGRFVAADTRLLPFGTKVSIPDYHGGTPVEVIDRGKDIKGNRLDVFFPRHADALDFGRRWIKVAVVDKK